MPLDHPLLEQFEPILKELHWAVFNAGIDALKEQGLLRHDRDLKDLIAASSSIRRRFFRGCHFGFDRAQRKAGDLVIKYELRRRELHNELKRYRKEKAKDEEQGCLDLLACLSARQVVLRRLVDSILQHVVHMEPWILRRTQTSDSIHRIDPVVLARTLRIAVERNRENRQCIHIVSDLTTAIQIGDLVKFCLDKKPPRWEIVELKEGRVNDALQAIIADETGDVSASEIAATEQTFGDKGVSQLQRMLRQRKREAEIENFRLRDRGIDPKTGETITLNPKEVTVIDYFETLRDACSSVKTKGESAFTVSKCLRVLVLSDVAYEKRGRWGVAHILYHLNNDRSQCALNSPDTVVSEMEAIAGMWDVVDLLEANLYSLWPSPVFMWPMPEPMVFDIVMGRLKLFAHLDFDVLFARAREKGIHMDWIAQRDERPVLRHSPPISRLRGRRGIRATMPTISTHVKMEYMQGFFGRIFLEFMSPDQLLSLIQDDIRRFEEKRREREAPESAPPEP
jgi:hypothetical protein